MRQRHCIFFRLLRCTQGVAAIEAAVIVPILAVLLLGVAELSRAAMLQQRLDIALNTATQMVVRSSAQAISQRDLNTVDAAMREVLKPYDFNGSLIFTSVVNDRAVSAPCANFNPYPCVIWQYKTSGTDSSAVGLPGANANIPGGYALGSGQNVIVAEIYYPYTPIFIYSATIMPSLMPRNIYKSVVYKPRMGALTALTP